MWIERLLGLEPRPAPPHVFGVEPGRLRYAGFGREGRVHQLREEHAVALDGSLWAPVHPGFAPREVAQMAERVGELLERVSGGVKQASLVLPDDWLRLAFLELGELPRDPGERDEVLRFKLKRLVPFRVDELRISAVEVPPLASPQEPVRALVGFAAEAGLARFEEAFERHGVHLGRITNRSLAASAALLAGMADGERDLLLLSAQAEGFSLVGWQGGSPVLFRQKAVPVDWDEATRAEMLVRELRLTRAFVEERLGDLPLGRVVVAADRSQETVWCDAVTEGLDAEPVPLRAGLLPIAGLREGSNWVELAPLLGAACEEVE